MFSTRGRRSFGRAPSPHRRERRPTSKPIPRRRAPSKRRCGAPGIHSNVEEADMTLTQFRPVQLGRRTASLAALVVATLALAATAHASIGIAPSIRGAGIIEGSYPVGWIRLSAAGEWLYTNRYDCESRNRDDRIVTACPVDRGYGWSGQAGPLILRAKTPPDLAHQGVTVRWEDCPTETSTAVCTIPDGAGADAPARPVAVFDDDRDPEVSWGGHAFEDRSVTTWFAVDEPDATTRCALDFGRFAPCSSPVQHRELAEGEHVLRLEAMDPSGNLTQEDWRFKVVDTRIARAPAAVERRRTVSFEFATAAGEGFLCSLDGRPYSACASPHTVTVGSDGRHTLRVFAKAGAFEDKVPAEHVWITDTVAPDTVLDPTRGPAPGVALEASTATFWMHATERGGVQCRIDRAGWAPCSSPHVVAGLAPGPHLFEARAVDAAGNVDPTPGQRRWTVISPDRDGDGHRSPDDCRTTTRRSIPAPATSRATGWTRTATAVTRASSRWAPRSVTWSGAADGVHRSRGWW
jgi:hypothetical protein